MRTGNAAVNSSCAQPPPPPTGKGGVFARLVTPGGGAFENFTLPGARAFANPELLTRTRFPIRILNYTEDLSRTGKN